jgi:SAM-dependent methyltransferase
MVRSQADIFFESEGDAWFERNREHLGEHDPVCDLIGEIGLIPTNVLEVGCADGRRLATLRERYGCRILGIEPSWKAVVEAIDRKVPMLRATADTLPAPADNAFDMVIYGFCLYVTDPEDWFRIAFEGDRVLKEDGHLIIHDFLGRGFFARHYKHRPGIMAYHYDFSQLWLAHPHYHVVRRTVLRDVGDQMITVLKKATVCEVRP